MLVISRTVVDEVNISKIGKQVLGTRGKTDKNPLDCLSLATEQSVAFEDTIFYTFAFPLDTNQVLGFIDFKCKIFQTNTLKLLVFVTGSLRQWLDYSGEFQSQVRTLLESEGYKQTLKRIK